MGQTAEFEDGCYWCGVVLTKGELDTGTTIRAPDGLHQQCNDGVACAHRQTAQEAACRAASGLPLEAETYLPWQQDSPQSQLREKIQNRVRDKVNEWNQDREA